MPKPPLAMEAYMTKGLLAATTWMDLLLKFKGVADPRCPRGKRHPLPGMLVSAVLSFALGLRPLRVVEELVKLIGPKGRRRLGLKSGFSDTALYDVLKKLEPDEFRALLAALVEQAFERGWVTNDLFALGLMAFDGKGLGGEKGTAPNSSARASVCDAEGTACWDVYALRAVLVSSTAQPCVDQEVIGPKSGEPTKFPVLFKRVAERFGSMFAIVSGDAGLTSAANAEYVTAHDKDYIFAVKGNQPTLFEYVQRVLPGTPVLAETRERAQGLSVVRTLRCVVVGPEVGFPRATEVWAVMRIATGRRNGEAVGEVETRYFVTSIEAGTFTAQQKLLLVRMHWGIENGSNWTADVMLKEDTQCPVKKDNGALVVSWLNLIALFLLGVFRAMQRPPKGPPLSWTSTMMRLVVTLLVVLGVIDVSDIA